MTGDYQELEGVQVLEEEGEALYVVAVAAGMEEALLLQVLQAQVAN